MSKAKFTKGEWKVIKSGESFLDGGLLVSVTSKSEDKSKFYFENEILIAATTNDDKEAEANASLIAAAPKMYKFLESLQLDVTNDYLRDELLAEARGES